MVPHPHLVHFYVHCYHNNIRIFSIVIKTQGIKPNPLCTPPEAQRDFKVAPIGQLGTAKKGQTTFLSPSLPLK